MAVLDEDRGRVCVSIEWGSFGDEAALGPVLTTFDHILDQESVNPGAQRWPDLLLWAPPCSAPHPSAALGSVPEGPASPFEQLQVAPGAWPGSKKEGLKVLELGVFNSWPSLIPDSG